MVAYLQLVRYKEHRLVFAGSFDSFMEDMGTNASIDRTERVIQEHYGPLAVESPSQTHSLTLPSTQVGPSLTNLGKESKKKTKLLKTYPLVAAGTIKEAFDFITKSYYLQADTSVMSP